MKTFKEMAINESPVGQRGRTSVKDAQVHITPELEKQFFKIVKELGGKTVAFVLLNKISYTSIGTNDSVLKRYKDSNEITSKKLHEDVELNENEYEDVLLKHNIKIKSKFETKFGTEFKLAKKYDDKKIRDILKNYNVAFSDDSIFVSK